MGVASIADLEGFQPLDDFQQFITTNKYKMKPLFKSILLLSFAFLVACGGGSAGSGYGGTVYVNLNFPSSTLVPWTYQEIKPNLSGFDSYRPQCELISGSIPLGMTINQDCTIWGTPQKTGNHSFSVKVTAKELTGEFNRTGYITVSAPSFKYKLGAAATTTPMALSTLDNFSDVPVINNGNAWPAANNVAISWKYELVQGSLPPGITLTASTGVIAGKPTIEGTYQPTIQATATSSLGTVVFPSFFFRMTVSKLSLAYSVTGDTKTAAPDFLIGQPINISPFLTPATTSSSALVLNNFALAATTKTSPTSSNPTLPTGLDFNPTTGAITGTPIASNEIYQLSKKGLNTAVFEVSANFNQNGTPTPLTIKYTKQFDLPYYSYYSPYSYIYTGYSYAGTIGKPILPSPMIRFISNGVLPDSDVIQFSKVNSASCAWDFGMNLDSITGGISGTPTKAGTFPCAVMATVTRNGVTWRQSMDISFTFK